MGKYGWRDNSIKTKKIIVEDKVPVRVDFPGLVATSTTAILNGANLTTKGTAAYENADILVQPPYAMAMTVQAVNDGTAANTDALTFVGLDAAGNTISESIVVSSTAGTTNTGKKAFAKITSITANTTTASTDCNVGYAANIIGLPYPLAATADIITETFGAFATSANTLAAATTSNITALSTTNNTITGANFSSAGGILSLTYKTKLQNK